MDRIVVTAGIFCWIVFLLTSTLFLFSGLYRFIGPESSFQIFLMSGFFVFFILFLLYKFNLFGTERKIIHRLVPARILSLRSYQRAGFNKIIIKNRLIRRRFSSLFSLRKSA